jgi:hypothetical protein
MPRGLNERAYSQPTREADQGWMDPIGGSSQRSSPWPELSDAGGRTIPQKRILPMIHADEQV